MEKGEGDHGKRALLRLAGLAASALFRWAGRPTALQRTIDIDCGMCRLRAWRKSDAPALVRHANDRDIWLNLRDQFPHPYRDTDAAAFIRWASSQEPVVNFAMIVNDEAAGGIGLKMGVDVERYSAEIGYWLGRAYWGRGIATAAVRAVTEYAFTTLGLLRVFALPFAENAASVRVLEKAGYIREGLLRASAVKAGQVRDAYVYASVRAR